MKNPDKKNIIKKFKFWKDQYVRIEFKEEEIKKQKQNPEKYKAKDKNV